MRALTGSNPPIGGQAVHGVPVHDVFPRRCMDGRGTLPTRKFRRLQAKLGSGSESSKTLPRSFKFNRKGGDTADGRDQADDAIDRRPPPSPDERRGRARDAQLEEDVIPLLAMRFAGLH